MVRRNFLKTISAGGVLLITPPGLHGMTETNAMKRVSLLQHNEILTADIVIIGGGLGGVASALSSLRNGLLCA